MWLINTATLKLEEYFGEDIPKYAILSHKWREEEVAYKEWEDIKHISFKKGFQKIRSGCIEAQRQSIGYLWVDTCCINKESSADLTEAINSMYIWYHRSQVCFVYLDDFRYSRDNMAGFRASRWFSRGWTLQELIAPRKAQFFDASWTEFGSKRSLLPYLSSITTIPMQCLVHPDSIRLASVAERMSWMAGRSTTREEDMAYCLLGMFEINMPLLYGEGRKAFIRLQEEIIRYNNDQTIFCWSWPQSADARMADYYGCLAPSPDTFRDSGAFNRQELEIIGPSEFQFTNQGLRINLALKYNLINDFKLAMLQAGDITSHLSNVCICVKVIQGGTLGRSTLPLLKLPRSWFDSAATVYLAHERDPSRTLSFIRMPYFRTFWISHRYAILPIPSDAGSRLLQRKTTSNHEYDTHGPILALEQAREGFWKTEFMAERENGVDIRIEIEVQIESVQDSEWTTMIRLTHEGMQGTSKIVRVSLLQNYEFTIGSAGTETTLVRPILIPVLAPTEVATFDQNE